jgi:hypothetical protein
VTNSSNSPIGSATVTFRVCFKTSTNGSWGNCTNYTATTNSSGQASYTLNGISDGYVAIQVTVQSITKSGTTFTLDSTASTKNAP